MGMRDGNPGKCEHELAPVLVYSIWRTQLLGGGIPMPSALFSHCYLRQ